MRFYQLLFVYSVLCIITLDAVAQQNPFKNERRIYLWDVTLSMKGYNNKTPNIYDKVIAALEKDINSILDEQTDIWVLPFQTSIIEKWNEKATSIGKKKIVDRIKAFKDETITNTNITVPMDDVMKTLIAEDKRNVLILLTDGEQNAKGYPMESLLDLIHQWCAFAEENDAYAFYVMLTEFAKNENLIRAIDETCRIHKVLPNPNGEIDINIVELLPQSNYKYNIKDDAGKKMNLKIDCKKRVTIPEGLKLHCFCEPNSYVEIDEAVSIINGNIEIGVKLKENYEFLKSNLPQNTNERLMLHFEVENSERFPLVQLLNEKCSLELINKPEKKLRVYVK